MVFGGLLWLIALSLAWRGSEAKLYVTKVRPKYIRLPEKEDISMRELRHALHRRGLRSDHIPFIHFDQAECPMEVMRLPLGFFDEFFNEQQLVEITLNANLKTLLNGKFRRGMVFQDKQRMKEKLALVRMKLGFLRADNLGDQIDRVIERVPSSLYRFLNPFTALSSTTFKATAQGFMRLFYLGRGSLQQLSTETQSSVMATFNELSALRNSPNRLFAAGRLLIGLSRRYDDLANLFRDRIRQFVYELQNVVDEVRAKTLVTKAHLTRFVAAQGLPTKTAFATEATWRIILPQSLITSSTIAEQMATISSDAAAVLDDQRTREQDRNRLDRALSKSNMNVAATMVNDLLSRLFYWASTMQDLVSSLNDSVTARIALLSSDLPTPVARTFRRAEKRTGQLTRAVTSLIAKAFALLMTSAAFNAHVDPYTTLVTISRRVATLLPHIFAETTKLSEKLRRNNANAAAEIATQANQNEDNLQGLGQPKRQGDPTADVWLVKSRQGPWRRKPQSTSTDSSSSTGSFDSTDSLDSTSLLSSHLTLSSQSSLTRSSSSASHSSY